MIEQTVTGSGRVVVVGHRGADGYAPENTMVSFEKAAALGAHAFECDVRLTRDGKVVVLHDATVDRVSSGSGAVADMTLAELRALDFGVHFPQFGVQSLPTLAEALEAAKRLGIEIVVEIKGEPEPPRQLVSRVVALVREADMVERCAIISFYHPCLAWVREQDDRLSTGILFGHDTPDPVAEARAFGANSVRPYYGRVTERLADDVHAAGLCLHTWNANDPDLTRRLALMGADSLGSDRPDVVRQTLFDMGRLA